MINTGKFIKELRTKRKLSQRKFANLTNISYRQIQRIENSQSDITLGKFKKILGRLGFEIIIKAKEPDWNALHSIGMPLNLKDYRDNKYSYKIMVKNIIFAAQFLIENRENINYQRHYDSFKALLLALKIHYPTRFARIENDFNVDFSASFELINIYGRHIKLRNICIYDLSKYIRSIQ